MQRTDVGIGLISNISFAFQAFCETLAQDCDLDDEEVEEKVKSIILEVGQ